MASSKVKRCIRKGENMGFEFAGRMLPPDELYETLNAPNKANLFIGGEVDHEKEEILLWRGDLSAFRVPFDAFKPSGAGLKPNFKSFSITDYGQTIKLGRYEAASDAVLPDQV